MGRVDFLAMKTSEEKTANLISSDLNEFVATAKKLLKDVGMLGGVGLGTCILQWTAFISSIYLLVLDRTNWKTEMSTTLLMPYILLTLPPVIFDFLKGGFGKWFTIIAISIRVSNPKEFPGNSSGQQPTEWLEVPVAVIIFVMVVEKDTEFSWLGAVMCLVIACYLFYKHIKACGGFKNAFTETNGISNTLGIIPLLVYPVGAIFSYIF